MYLKEFYDVCCNPYNRRDSPHIFSILSHEYHYPNILLYAVFHIE